MVLFTFFKTDSGCQVQSVWEGLLKETGGGRHPGKSHGGLRGEGAGPSPQHPQEPHPPPKPKSPFFYLPVLIQDFPRLFCDPPISYQPQDSRQLAQESPASWAVSD